MMMAQSGDKAFKEAAHFSDYGIQVSDMCSELSYFVVFDFSYAQQDPQHLARKPTIVTYRHHSITFNEILNRYRKLCPASQARKNLKFTLSRGYLIPMRSTVLDLKKSLRRDSVEGVVLFTYQGFEEEEEEGERVQGDFVNECGLMDYIGQEDGFEREKQFTFHFLIPRSKLIISIQIHPNERVSVLVDRFFKEVARQFSLTLDKEDVKQFRIRGTTAKDGVLRMAELIANHRQLYDGTEIELVLANKDLEFYRHGKEEHIITLVKEEFSARHGAKSGKTLKLNYEDVKNMAVDKINSQFFLEKEQQENHCIPICLKVMDFIIRGDEKLMKLNLAIQKLKELGEVKLVGYFISEKMVFYRQIPELLQGKDAKEFTLEELDIPSEEFNERNKCDKMINERLGAIQEAYFKNRSHVEPIFVYTSNLKYKDKNTNEVSKIYDSLNRQLRNDSVLKKKPQELSESWAYRYTSTLLKHLKNIPGEKATVYRGVDYDPEGKVGELLTFKPFTSTSKNIRVALQFAVQNYMANPEKPLTLFEMNILSGKPIDKLSYFSTEAELLLEPFTEFKIVKIDKDVSKLQGFESLPKEIVDKFTIYRLQEVDSDKEMPKTINNYILWIDDKPHEGRDIFNKFIEEYKYPSVLFQIPSTDKLREWIAERQSIVNDSDSKIIMITNMVRTQNGVKNFYAGVEAINVIREALPNIPIAVYVRDTNASNNNLNEKNVGRQNLVVINQFQELANFTSEHTALKFRSLIPKEESLHQTQPTINNPPPVLQKQSKSVLESKGGKGGKGDKGGCQVM